MASYKGALVLLRIGDGQESETFTTIGGMRTTKFVLNNKLVDATNLDSGAWREIMDTAGVASLRISGGGFFTDSTEEESLRSQAFGNTLKNYELYFGNGDTLSGAFQITQYERIGDFDDHELYSITLESSGAVSFVKG